jgi:hypothetical protein
MVRMWNGLIWGKSRVLWRPAPKPLFFTQKCREYRYGCHILDKGILVSKQKTGESIVTGTGTPKSKTCGMQYWAALGLVLFCSA